MFNFEFKNPTKLIFGKGKIAKIAKEIPAGAKVMVTYGGGSIKKNGVYEQVVEALKGVDFIEEGGIEPNPHYETLMRITERCRAEGIDFLLAVGGGSVIDGTKFIASAMKYTAGDPWEFMIDITKLNGSIPVPIASVLTLPATGSEMNCGAVITRNDTKEKLAFQYPLNYPVFSVLDPSVCASLPEKQVANGVADTYAHVLEQYLTFPSQAMVQDRFSEGVLLTLNEIGAKVVKNRSDYDLDSNYMYAATMGLNGFISMGVPQDWATHMIGHELTALHGLDHGVTLSIIFPSLINEMREEKRDKILQYGERVFGINSGSDDSRIDKTIACTRSFFESLGINTHLERYGIGEETFDIIVKRFEKRGWVLGEKQNITPQRVLNILRGAK